MSLDLAAEREWVAGILRGLDLGGVLTYLPSRLVVPAFMVIPDSPYLTPGQTFKTARIRLRVVFAAAAGANQDEQTAVDTAISRAASAFVSQGISIEGASLPYAGTAGNGQAYLSADLNISFTIDL